MSDDVEKWKTLLALRMNENENVAVSIFGNVRCGMSYSGLRIGDDVEEGMRDLKGLSSG